MPFRTLIFAFTLLVPAAAPAAHAPVFWQGAFRLPAGADGVGIAVEVAGNSARVTLAPGHAGPQRLRVRRHGNRLTFTLPGRPKALSFDGTVRSRTLAGTVRQGTARGTFSLTRVRSPSMRLGAPGLYALDSGGTLAIVDLANLLRLVDLDSGDIRGLFPSGASSVA